MRTDHARPERGFAALLYVIMLSASLLLLTVTAYAHELVARQQLAADEDADRARIAATACVSFALRALTQNPERPLPPDRIVYADTTTVCSIESATRSGNDLTLVTHAHVHSQTVRLKAEASRDASGTYRLTKVRDYLK